MLKATLYRDDLYQDWSPTSDGGWRLGHKSAITPLKSPFLGSIAHQCCDAIAFSVMEVSCEAPPKGYDSAALQAWVTHQTAGDGVLIVLPKVQRAPPSFHRTAHAAVPLFISIEPESVTLSWDFEEILRSRSELTISRHQARQFIVHGPKAERNSLVNDVFWLLPGDSACWQLNPAKLDIANPTDLTPFEPSILTPNADVIGAFTQLIQNAIAPHLDLSRHPVIELSAGLDSSCLAVAAAKLYPKGLRAYSLVHEGVAGEQQTHRIQEIASKLRLENKSITSSLCRPFSSMSDESLPNQYACGIYDEIYWDGVLAALNSVSEEKLDLVLTGIGGDELTLINSEDVPSSDVCWKTLFFGDTPPVSDNAPPVLTGVTSSFIRARLFLHQGVWPKSPYIDPQIIQFAQMLPEALKKDRLLNRMMLARGGLSDYFIFPRYRENFDRVFMNDLITFNMDRYFSESVLHDHRILNTSQISEQYRRLINTGNPQLPMLAFYTAVRLECLLRRYIRQKSCRFSD